MAAPMHRNTACKNDSRLENGTFDSSRFSSVGTLLFTPTIPQSGWQRHECRTGARATRVSDNEITAWHCSETRKRKTKNRLCTLGKKGSLRNHFASKISWILFFFHLKAHWSFVKPSLLKSIQTTWKVPITQSVKLSLTQKGSKLKWILTWTGQSEESIQLV